MLTYKRGSRQKQASRHFRQRVARRHYFDWVFSSWSLLSTAVSSLYPSDENVLDQREFQMNIQTSAQQKNGNSKLRASVERHCLKRFDAVLTVLLDPSPIGKVRSFWQLTLGI
jgi:hypothetical protein